MWDEVSGLMKSPATLTADLERMVELERQDKRGDPDREARVWLDKLTEVDQERRGYLRLVARGCMSDEDLDEALVGLEEARKAAQRELEALKYRRERIEQLVETKWRYATTTRALRRRPSTRSHPKNGTGSTSW